MITLKLCDQNNNVIDKRSHIQETYLAYKNRTYNNGEKIIVELDEPDQFIWVQVDEALEPSLIYMKQKVWTYPVILDESLKKAYSPKLFQGERHYIRAYKVSEIDRNRYRNLARNAHDQRDDSGAYPHASANVETRNDSTFFARNAIDGMIANQGHGSFPYQSWGINQQEDAELSIDFGREVDVSEVALVLRADYPHDSFWTNVTFGFSDGEKVTVETTNDLDRQFFKIENKVTNSITLKNLIKNKDSSPFPALTQVEVYGREIKR
ncbi:hypothetical protein BKP56_05175 [Marinilactibacillus sp. 15R]|uniref:hypothetical protein n=1 Tax=Marinilactibacillus sp. 15R TaxID=1911586 RepID=UPI00090B8946|nr:hypothetical protein [Marinilactibacillus sp. 15R]API88716.1 hypothetical protein BKP56_05175 [Marinilactibacillus sp. 15R]